MNSCIKCGHQFDYNQPVIPVEIVDGFVDFNVTTKNPAPRVFVHVECPS